MAMVDVFDVTGVCSWACFDTSKSLDILLGTAVAAEANENVLIAGGVDVLHINDVELLFCVIGAPNNGFCGFN